MHPSLPPSCSLLWRASHPKDPAYRNRVTNSAGEIKTAAKSQPSFRLKINGRGERIRTSDLSVPNRALYQAEPRPDNDLDSNTAEGSKQKAEGGKFSVLQFRVLSALSVTRHPSLSASASSAARPTKSQRGRLRYRRQSRTDERES